MRKIGCRWNCSGVGHPSPCSTHPHGTRTLYSLYLLCTKLRCSRSLFSPSSTLRYFHSPASEITEKMLEKIPIRREVRTCVRLPPPPPSMLYCLSLFKSDPIISHRFPFNRPEQKHFSNKFFLRFFGSLSFSRTFCCSSVYFYANVILFYLFIFLSAQLMGLLESSMKFANKSYYNKITKIVCQTLFACHTTKGWRISHNEWQACEKKVKENATM